MFGNLGQMASLLGKVNEIRQGFETLKKELPAMEFTAKSGGVTAVIGGDFELRRLEVDPGTEAGAIAPCARDAVNQASALAKTALRNRVKELSGGIDLPGIF